MALMCNRRLDFEKLSRSLGVDFPARYAGELASLEDLVADGVLARSARGIEVTRVGVPLLRVAAMRFDATLSGAARQHSKAI
jgi:oxygen-independent coproporphyrinogen-3 oxidase